MEQKWKILEWFQDLKPDEATALAAYDAQIKKFNTTLNLVSTKAATDLDNLHFADCLLACRIFLKQPRQGEKVYDLGSGNGFPGLVLSILDRSLPVVLVEADVRKSEFLKHVIHTLGLKSCEVLTQTIESLPKGSIQTAICRGLAPLSRSLVIARSCVAAGGCIYHMKSEEWASEIAQIPTQICSYWNPELVAEYRLPLGEIRYALVRTERLQD